MNSYCKKCGRKERIAYEQTERAQRLIKKRSARRTEQDRQEEKRRAAAKKGKEYKTREEISESKRIALLVKDEVSALKRIKANNHKKPWNRKGLDAGARYKIRYKLDEEFNLKERLRRQITKQAKKDKYADMIRNALKRDGSSPTIHSTFGYSISELKDHLTKRFSPGMTWDAFMQGEIHIDHIKPIAAHDLSNKDEFLSCWSLENLQPLWAKDNLAKGAKWNDE